MKAIIYTRVSTEEQKTGHSIDAQLESCRAYCKAKSWDIVIEYMETGSGKNVKSRPQLNRALTLMEEEIADVLIVWRLDRLTRSIMDFQKIVERIGPKIASVTEGLDMSTTAGRFVANILISFAQYERESISERTKVALQKARKEGKQIGRKREIPPEMRKKIKMLRRRGFTYREISEKTGISMWTVRYICEHG